MNRMQIIIVVLLVTMVLGVFAALGYLLLANNRQPAATPSPPAAPPPTAVAQQTAAPKSTASPTRPRATATPSRWAGATAASSAAAKSMAQATQKAVTTATAEAQAKIDAIMRRMPAGDIGLVAENARLSLTISRMAWLGPGSLSMKLQIVNKGQSNLTLDPTWLVLEDAKKGLNALDQSVTDTLPGALKAGALAPGASADGQVAFKLPLQTAPAGLVYSDGQGDPLKIDIMDWIVHLPKATATSAP